MFYNANFSNFIAVINLTKTSFFGYKETIAITITPSFKIIKIECHYRTKIPFKKGEIINLKIFSEWLIKNNYNMVFSTKNSKFKRELYFLFDDIIINNKKELSIISKILKYVKSLSIFRVFIKK